MEAIEKTMTLQETRIKAMENSLAKMKTEKEEAINQKKYGEERFFKFKTTAQKEIHDTKKTVQAKEQVVNKLKSELKKTESVVA